MRAADETLKNDGLVRQSSVIPYRITDGRLEFCLITTRRSRRWGFPKGRIRKHSSPEATGLEEAHEEAGLSGRIIGEPLGEYRYTKQRRRYHVLVLLMAVDSESPHWQEEGERARHWVSGRVARTVLDRRNLIEMLDAAVMQVETLGEPPATLPVDRAG